jgi:SAM-dependent methyltransferase
VATDIDPNMIEFARNNYSSNTIEYITQDISQSWDELNTTLKELEAKVSLIFSNRVLHWVEDKETAAKNISRLLSNGGKICLNITVPIDVRPNLSEQLREKFIEIPTIDEQFEIWRKILISVGIELSFAQILNKEAFYDKKFFSSICFSLFQKINYCTFYL